MHFYLFSFTAHDFCITSTLNVNTLLLPIFMRKSCGLHWIIIVKTLLKRFYHTEKFFFLVLSDQTGYTSGHTFSQAWRMTGQQKKNFCRLERPEHQQIKTREGTAKPNVHLTVLKIHNRSQQNTRDQQSALLFSFCRVFSVLAIVTSWLWVKLNWVYCRVIHTLDSLKSTKREVFISIRLTLILSFFCLLSVVNIVSYE